MTIIDSGMLWRQFAVAIDALGDALRGCPDDLWEKPLWPDEPDQWVAAGFSRFWYQGYHTLFWLDLYLTGAEEGFAPPPPFDLVEMQAGELLPPFMPAWNCSATWKSAARDAGRRSKPCQPSRPAGSAGSPGARCLSGSCCCTSCAMSRNTPPSCTCSWDSGASAWRDAADGQPGFATIPVMVRGLVVRADPAWCSFPVRRRTMFADRALVTAAR